MTEIPKKKVEEVLDALPAIHYFLQNSGSESETVQNPAYMEVGIDDDHRFIEMTVSTDPSRYVPHEVFTLNEAQTVHDYKHYSLKRSIREATEFFEIVRNVSREMSDIYAITEDLADLPYYWEDLVDLEAVVDVIDDMRLHKQTFMFSIEGCDAGGYSSDRLEITEVFLDGSFLYCDVKGELGCHGVLEGRVEGEEGRLLVADISDAIDIGTDGDEESEERFWKVLDIATRYVEK